MIIDGQIDPYFEKAHIQASGSPVDFLLPHKEEAGELFGDKMDAILRREYDADLAEKLVGKRVTDKVLDEPIDWECEDGPDILDPGYILFASEIDWDAGIVRCDWLPNERDVLSIWFPSGEFLYSEFEHPDFTARLEGMAFELSRIEMLLPNVGREEQPATSRSVSRQLNYIGRPRKWDWEGALAFIISQAQTPDGLPTGHGAQAKIETVMAEWFEESAGSSPSISQIRQRASKVMRLIEKDEKG